MAALQEMDLVAGESLQIGQHMVTVLDIDGEQVTFRIENLESGEIYIHPTQMPRPK